MRRRVDLRGWTTGALIVLALVTLSCRVAAEPQVDAPIATHPVLFFDEATFFSSVRDAEDLPPPNSVIAGAIVPHDWRGGRYITWLFQSLAEHPPDTVILIGPNHDNEGYPGFLTSELSWSTPFGVVQPDSGRIRALVQSDEAFVDETVLTSEHSVAGLMPAIAYYLPGARVVPLIVRGDAGPEDVARLGQALASSIDSRVIIVAAVDFSHDLTSDASARNNELTLQALRTGNDAMLFTLDNRYLDSPESIAALMAAMSSLDAGPFRLTADTNSAALRGDELAPTTSYLVGYYPVSPTSAAAGAP